MPNNQKVMIGDGDKRVIVELNRLLCVEHGPTTDAVFFYFDTGNIVEIQGDSEKLFVDLLAGLEEYAQFATSFPEVPTIMNAKLRRAIEQIVAHGPYDNDPEAGSRCFFCETGEYAEAHKEGCAYLVLKEFVESTQ